MRFLEPLIEELLKNYLLKTLVSPNNNIPVCLHWARAKKTFRLKVLVIRKHEKMPPSDQHLINFSKYEAILVCQKMNILQLFFFFRVRLIS